MARPSPTGNRATSPVALRHTFISVWLCVCLRVHGRDDDFRKRVQTMATLLKTWFSLMRVSEQVFQCTVTVQTQTRDKVTVEVEMAVQYRVEPEQ
eukprot:2235746-Rhodomonas_salina.1